MTCFMCRRKVIVAWFRDGTDERVCPGCVNRALREADRILEQESFRRTLERFRRMGFG